MALKTADQYLDEIRARTPRVFYRGEPMTDVVDHPVAGPAAACVAEVYRAALDPEIAPLITRASEREGAPVNASNILWRSRDDLIDRVKWERLIGRRTGRGALRSPGLDAINALAAVTHRCDRERGTGYHERLLAFVERMQREDLAVSGAMTDVRGDRSKRPGQQPDMFLRVVERSPDGVVLRGAKAHQTSAIHCHEHVVLPMTCAPDETDHAIACAVPLDAAGITHIYARQPSDSRRAEDAPLDVGLPAFGGCESLMIFEDVFVPSERIFLDGEAEYTQELVRLFGSFHRFCYGGCKVGIADVVIGAASLIARANGVREASGIRRKLTEMVHLNETMYACGLAAALEGRPTEAGFFQPDIALANVTKLNVTRLPFEIARLAADIAGGAMLTLPSQADLEHPELGPLVERYLGGAADVPTRERMAIFRLLEFLTHGSGAVYFLHESLHGAGAPEAMRIILEREIDLAPLEASARALLAH